MSSDNLAAYPGAHPKLQGYLACTWQLLREIPSWHEGQVSGWFKQQWLQGYDEAVQFLVEKGEL